MTPGGDRAETRGDGLNQILAGLVCRSRKEFGINPKDGDVTKGFKL